MDAPPDETRRVDPDQPTTDEPRRVGTIVKLSLGLIVLAMVVMWIYALGPWARRDPPGRLDDPSFADAAEVRCATTVDDLEAVPQAYETTTPQERAAAIRETDAIIDSMLDDLRAMAPTTGEDARRVNEWLDDWETYLEDRANLSAELAAGHDARIKETTKGGDHITQALDFFAVTANDMPSCATPNDVS